MITTRFRTYRSEVSTVLNFFSWILFICSNLQMILEIPSHDLLKYDVKSLAYASSWPRYLNWDTFRQQHSATIFLIFLHHCSFPWFIEITSANRCATEIQALICFKNQIFSLISCFMGLNGYLIWDRLLTNFSIRSSLKTTLSETEFVKIYLQLVFNLSFMNSGFKIMIPTNNVIDNTVDDGSVFHFGKLAS